MRTLIVVENLNNYSNATEIIGELESIQGVEIVFIEPKECIVEIIHREQIDINQIKNKLISIGYPPLN